MRSERRGGAQQVCKYNRRNRAQESDEEEREEGEKEKGGMLSRTFMDAISLAPSTPTEGGGGGETVVRHKQEQKDLLTEEERAQYDALIKDIKKKTEPWNKMMRRINVFVAKNLF